MMKFIWFLLGHIVVLILIIVTWYFMWLKNVGVEIPIDKCQMQDSSIYTEPTHTTKSLREFWYLFKNSWRNTNEDYWIKNCGLDGYLYIVLQRKFLYVMIIIFPISLILSLLYNLQDDPSFQIVDARWRNDWTVGVLFGNKNIAKGAWSWVQVWMCLFVSYFTIKTIYRLREKSIFLYK